MRLPYPVRHFGGRVIGRVPVRIRGGPNRGCRWSLASTGRGYRSGRFNAERVDAIVRLTRPGMRVWDVGAHKGYLALAFARLVGPAGHVLSVEPSEQNLWYLHRHLRWNGATNVTVVEAAASDTDGEALFGGHGSTTALKLGGGRERVRTIRLATLLAERAEAPPDLIKMDIEGAEGAALAGAGDALTDRSIVFVSVHDRAQHAACAETLATRGYRIVESAPMRVRTADADLPWGGDHELLALGPRAEVDVGDVTALPLFA